MARKEPRRYVEPVAAATPGFGLLAVPVFLAILGSAAAIPLAALVKELTS